MTSTTISDLALALAADDPGLWKEVTDGRVRRRVCREEARGPPSFPPPISCSSNHGSRARHPLKNLVDPYRSPHVVLDGSDWLHEASSRSALHSPTEGYHDERYLLLQLCFYSVHSLNGEVG